jgi:hypothetical protein
VTPLRVKKAGRRITPTGCFTAVLLGLAFIYGVGAADAADGRHSRAPVTPNTFPSGSNLNGAGYGASNNPQGPILLPGYGASINPQAPMLLPGAGWDRELDFSGVDYGGPAPLIIPGR